ncbi:hypothetical protein BJ912DRAFT_1042402 [Pholiota molesta]|nr:hypothetical protein BJ912DRAFT_1042402 [Pholiota molesta]
MLRGSRDLTLVTFALILDIRTPEPLRCIDVRRHGAPLPRGGTAGSAQVKPKSNTHRLENAMTLVHDFHVGFDTFASWFAETPALPQYSPSYPVRPRTQPTLNQWKLESARLRSVTTPPRSHSARHVQHAGPVRPPLPSPKYLTIHAACARVAQYSSAAEWIGTVYQEMYEGRSTRSTALVRLCHEDVPRALLNAFRVGFDAFAFWFAETVPPPHTASLDPLTRPTPSQYRPFYPVRPRTLPVINTCELESACAHDLRDYYYYPSTITLTTPDVRPPLPSPKYLAIHAACARVAPHSGAAEWIRRVYQEMDEGRSKGSIGLEFGAGRGGCWSGRFGRCRSGRWSE